MKAATSFYVQSMRYVHTLRGHRERDGATSEQLPVRTSFRTRLD